MDNQLAKSVLEYIHEIPEVQKACIEYAESRCGQAMLWDNGKLYYEGNDDLVEEDSSDYKLFWMYTNDFFGRLFADMMAIQFPK